MTKVSAPEAEPKEPEQPKKTPQAPQQSAADVVPRGQYEELRREHEALRQEMEQARQEESAQEGAQATIRKLAYERVRGPIGKILKYGPGVLMPPLLAVPLAHAVLKRTPLVRSLYPSNTIESLGRGTRDMTAKVLTAPLGALSIPGKLLRGLLGRGAGVVGGIGKKLHMPSWRPHAASGFERLGKLIRWTATSSKDAIVGTAEGLGKILIVPIKVFDNALSLILPKWVRIPATVAVGVLVAMGYGSAISAVLSGAGSFVSNTAWPWILGHIPGIAP